MANRDDCRRKVPQLEKSDRHTQPQMRGREQEDQPWKKLYGVTRRSTWAFEQESEPKDYNVKQAARIDLFNASYKRIGSDTESMPKSTYQETMHRSITEGKEPSHRSMSNDDLFFQRIRRNRELLAVRPAPLPDQSGQDFQTTQKDLIPHSPARQQERQANSRDDFTYHRRKSMFYSNGFNHLTGTNTWWDEVCPCPFCTNRPLKPILRESSPQPLKLRIQPQNHKER